MSMFSHEFVHEFSEKPTQNAYFPRNRLPGNCLFFNFARKQPFSLLRTASYQNNFDCFTGFFLQKMSSIHTSLPPICHVRIFMKKCNCLVSCNILVGLNFRKPVELVNSFICNPPCLLYFKEDILFVDSSSRRPHSPTVVLLTRPEPSLRAKMPRPQWRPLPTTTTAVCL